MQDRVEVIGVAPQAKQLAILAVSAVVAHAADVDAEQELSKSWVRPEPLCKPPKALVVLGFRERHQITFGMRVEPQQGHTAACGRMSSGFS